jgi:hypothetical protein
MNQLWSVLSALTGEDLTAMPYAARLPRLLNGQASGKFAPAFAAAGYRTLVLPSTSPAHASLSLEQKLFSWRQLKDSASTLG